VVVLERRHPVILSPRAALGLVSFRKTNGGAFSRSPVKVRPDLGAYAVRFRRSMNTPNRTMNPTNAIIAQLERVGICCVGGGGGCGGGGGALTMTETVFEMLKGSS